MVDEPWVWIILCVNSFWCHILMLISSKGIFKCILQLYYILCLMLCDYIFLIHSHCFGVGIVQYKNDTTIRGYISSINGYKHDFVFDASSHCGVTILCMTWFVLYLLCICSLIELIGYRDVLFSYVIFYNTGAFWTPFMWDKFYYYYRN